MTGNRYIHALFLLLAFLTGAAPALFGSNLCGGFFLDYSQHSAVLMIGIMLICCVLSSCLRAEIPLLFLTVLFGYFAALETDVIRTALFSGESPIVRLSVLCLLTSLQFCVCGMGLDMSFRIGRILKRENLSFRANTFILYAIMFMGFAAALRFGPDILNI